MPDPPRTLLSDTIEALALPQAQSYAEFIRAGDPGGPVPCWGALAERFDEEFTGNEDRKALWNALADSGDRRALLLFLELNRDRPEVMETVVHEANRLPPALQRTLVAFNEVTELVADHLDIFTPAARQLFEAGTEARAREHELVQSRVGRLRMYRYYVPDTVNPADESGVARGPRDVGSAPTDPEVTVTTVEELPPPVVLVDGGP